jgi:putative GTP pyrophosphokinase
MSNEPLVFDGAGSASGLPFELDRDAISAAYRSRHNVYKTLEEEVVFILKDRIDAENIKIHGIESRVKELDSLLVKCTRKNCNTPFDEFGDITGARVICLFRSDLERLKSLVGNNFDVISVDDKINEGDDPLGYLSIHMICRMKTGYSGPRYDKILAKHFEIQLRTLCMHCWAAVSHYVDYKGDWDVPANLKMALNALSGLFYVADSEFEQFNFARIKSKISAEQPSAERPSSEINLDTVGALLDSLFPSRKDATPQAVSELVKNIKEARYESLDELREDILKGQEFVNEYESEREGGISFNKVGAARVGLRAVSSTFEDQLAVRRSKTDPAVLHSTGISQKIREYKQRRGDRREV